ncbi:cryptochrome-1 [Bacillus rossius redtenbacheri]|uniref:cryptochrome-1 n=1 Tax=Bacillus rossius redtenbacheri TaxID=93214 RepID=UPI002FDDCB1E
MFSAKSRKVTVHWFRHGLRLHDNPALLEAIKDSDEFYPIFIFDGESAGTKLVGYNRMQFLVECLQDLNSQLRKHNAKLYVFRGSPVAIFKRMWEEFGLQKICFEQDPEAIWHARDETVKQFCSEHGIQCEERVSHTLWDPYLVIKTNGGVPPLTYQMFLHTTSVIGKPPRPVEDPVWNSVKFGKLPECFTGDFKLFSSIPTPQDFGLSKDETLGERMIRWVGGETCALQNLSSRLKVEETAFRQGFYLPNVALPDLLGPPTSQSPALRFGCLSVRRFYWSVHDLYNAVRGGEPPSSQSITGQLIWREFFYTMSADNPFYGEMERNPICLNIPWQEEKASDHLEKWKTGKTGFPFIDAVMRQLLTEGWVHHVGRNAVACFLTRGDLWLSWEAGLEHFLKNLLDADWSVCAGNWMWVSSSAFEQLLDCSTCVCPVNYGRRLDPEGTYIKRYIPELANFPPKYVYEPWRAPLDVQERAGCIIGKDYPERIVDHQQASRRNQKYMENIRNSLMNDCPPHCCPSNIEETRQFLWLPEKCVDHMCVDSTN